METKRLISIYLTGLFQAFCLIILSKCEWPERRIKFTLKVHQANVSLPEKMTEERPEWLSYFLQIQNWIKLPIGFTNYPSLPPLNFLNHGE